MVLICERQSNNAYQTTNTGPRRLYRMYHQGKSGSVVFIDTEADQRGYNHEMPWTNPTLHRHCYTDTAHREGYQTYRYAQIACEIKRIKGDIEIEEITNPDQQGLYQKQSFAFHDPNALNTCPDILQNSFRLLDQRKVTQIFEYKPNGKDNNYQKSINPDRMEHRLETHDQIRITTEETDEKLDVEDKD